MAPWPEVRIGTSGYVYPHWRKGVFYPSGLPAKQELAYYAARFRTVELNNPFYRLPTPEMFVRWRGNTPSDFSFAVKASRYITHIKRLHNVADEIALFMETGDHVGTYFNNDWEGFAVRDAVTFERLLGPGLAIPPTR
jgi:uncharacterized protein YecE (DUF72 family)